MALVVADAMTRLGFSDWELQIPFICSSGCLAEDPSRGYFITNTFFVTIASVVVT